MAKMAELVQPKVAEKWPIVAHSGYLQVRARFCCVDYSACCLLSLHAGPLRGPLNKRCFMSSKKKDTGVPARQRSGPAPEPELLQLRLLPGQMEKARELADRAGEPLEALVSLCMTQGFQWAELEYVPRIEKREAAERRRHVA